MRWGELLAANLSCQRIAVTANIRPIDTTMGSTPFEARIDFLSTRPLRTHNSGRGSRVDQIKKGTVALRQKANAKLPASPSGYLEIMKSAMAAKHATAKKILSCPHLDCLTRDKRLRPVDQQPNCY